VRCSLYLSQNGANALAWAAYKGHLAMVEFFLGLGFDLEAKDEVLLHYSYIACFFLYSSSVTGVQRAIRAFSLYKGTRVLSLARVV
jgi:ankyrin repeat protein